MDSSIFVESAFNGNDVGTINTSSYGQIPDDASALIIKMGCRGIVGSTSKATGYLRHPGDSNWDRLCYEEQQDETSVNVFHYPLDDSGRIEYFLEGPSDGEVELYIVGYI